MQKVCGSIDLPQMKYVVIGGGIAGICCTEELCRLAKPDDSVVLISAASVLKVGILLPS